MAKNARSEIHSPWLAHAPSAVLRPRNTSDAAIMIFLNVRDVEFVLILVFVEVRLGEHGIHCTVYQ